MADRSLPMEFEVTEEDARIAWLAALWALGWTVTTAGGIDVDQQWVVFGAYGYLTLAFLQSTIVGAFVPATSASSLAPLASGLAITRPLFSPTRPRYAIHWPSGDQCGSSDDSLSAPKRTLLPSANVITQT